LPNRPLDGIRVIDLTQVAAGPYGTSLLGDFGADVIKVEPPEGDSIRGADSIVGPGRSAYFYGVNRSKRNIAVDLRTAAGRDVLDRLVKDADVFVVAFRPAAVKRLGLDYERLSAINPKLIYCSLTAFGEAGPRVDEPGMDILAQALGGPMALTGEPDGPPVKMGPPMADFVVAYLFDFAVLAALHARDRDGTGQKIELSLLDGMLASMANYATPYLVSGKPIRRMGGGHPQFVPYQVFSAADRYIVVACLNDRFWPPLCAAIERPELANDPRYRTNQDRVLHRDELVRLLKKLLVGKPGSYWLERLQAHGVPCSPVNELEDALSDPQAVHNGAVVHLEHPVSGPYGVVNNPIRMSRTPAAISRPAADLGEHTREVLLEAGFTAAEVESLIADGAVIQA
jgi:crotonobetainyl-CoA:carnitine CoA-transferase CaiB-like acyl-CoA transferase